MHNDAIFKPNRLTLVTLMLSSMVILMGAAVVAPALVQIGDHFGLGQSDISLALVISLPALSVAVTGFAIGYLADRYGKVKVLFCSLLVFSIFGILPFFGGIFHILDDFTFVLLCRFILGVGLTGISTCTTALIGGYWTGEERGRIIGYQSAAIGVGGLVLETLGGSLGGIGWNMPFLVYLIGVVILLFGLLSVREPAQMVGIEQIPEPVIPDKRGRIVFCYLAVLVEMFLMFSLPINMSAYCSSEIGVDSTMCGLLLGLMGVLQAVMSLIYGRNANKMREESVYALAFLLMAVGLTLLFIPYLATAFVSMVLVGMSLGILMPTVIGSLTKLSTASDSGKIMGGYSVALNFATFLSGLLVTLIFNAVDQKFTSTFLVLAGISVFMAVVCAVKGLYSRRSVQSPDLDTVRCETVCPRAPASSEVSMYQSILVPTDGSESSNYAVENAVNIARKNNASLTALYVVDSDRLSGLAGDMASAESIKAASKEICDAALEFASELADRNGISITTKVMLGLPAESIIEASKDFDLVVCGSLGRTNLSRILMGSVAEKVVRLAYCPVLVCRQRRS